MVRTFIAQDEAKEFLIAKIIAQAKRDNVPLSDAERKMMYYSVEKPTVADEVADQFSEEDIEYEGKIRSLFSSAIDFDKNEREDYESAIAKLKKGDHYLSVLVGGSSNPAFLQPLDRFFNPPSVKAGSFRDQLRLFLTALGVIVVLMVFTIYWQSWKELFWQWFDSHFKK
jgi:hypothetical protein